MCILFLFGSLCNTFLGSTAVLITMMLLLYIHICSQHNIGIVKSKIKYATIFVHNFPLATLFHWRAEMKGLMRYVPACRLWTGVRLFFLRLFLSLYATQQQQHPTSFGIKKAHTSAPTRAQLSLYCISVHFHWYNISLFTTTPRVLFHRVFIRSAADWRLKNK